MLGHGNENCILPGQIEAQWADRVQRAGGLLFSEAEIKAFNEIAEECKLAPWDTAEFKAE